MSTLYCKKCGYIGPNSKCADPYHDTQAEITVLKERIAELEALLELTPRAKKDVS